MTKQSVSVGDVFKAGGINNCADCTLVA